jgi:hypothetical protein
VRLGLNILRAGDAYMSIDCLHSHPHDANLFNVSHDSKCIWFFVNKNIFTDFAASAKHFTLDHTIT